MDLQAMEENTVQFVSKYKMLLQKQTKSEGKDTINITDTLVKMGCQSADSWQYFLSILTARNP